MADSLERPVLSAANAALDRNGFVAPIDVLTGLGWLRTEHAEAWRRGRVPYLERVTVASLGKLSRALRILRRWAQQRGLQPRGAMRAGFPGNLLGRQIDHEGDLHRFERIGSLEHIPEHVRLQQERVLGRPALDRFAGLRQSP